MPIVLQDPGMHEHGQLLTDNARSTQYMECFEWCARGA
jgi:hypothetical protein